MPCLRLSELRLGGHKKARLLVQPGFFRDPVGIRTPNLRIRSAMLYPVELQGPVRHDRSQSEGKDRQASFPTKRPLVKTRKKRNPHRQGPSRCREFTELPMRILQALL